MAEVGLETKLGWEFRKSVTRIHFNPGVITTTSVGWLEGSVETWAMEGEKFVDSVSNTFERAAGPIDNPVGISGNITFGFGLANHLLGDFDEAVEDIANSASELT